MVSAWLHFKQRKGKRALFLEDSTRGLSLQVPDMTRRVIAKGKDFLGSFDTDVRNLG